MELNNNMVIYVFLCPADKSAAPLICADSFEKSATHNHSSVEVMEI